MHAASLSQQRTLLGAGKTTIDQTYNLSAMIQGHPQEVVVTAQADGVVVATQEGEVYYFYLVGNDLSLRQRFVPFKDLFNPAITSMDFLFGSVSLVFGSTSGANRSSASMSQKAALSASSATRKPSRRCRCAELLRHEFA